MCLLETEHEVLLKVIDVLSVETKCDRFKGLKHTRRFDRAFRRQKQSMNKLEIIFSPKILELIA